MSEQIEERIRKVESQLAFMKGAAIVAGACIAAFLGYTYTQIPKQVKAMVDDKIGAETMAHVKKFNDEYLNLAVTAETAAQKLGVTDLKQQIEKLPLPKYDSGWIKVEKAQSYPLTHNLGRLPRQVMCFAASDANGANMIVMDSVYSSAGYGAWVQDITQSNFVLSTGVGWAVSGYGKDDHFRWSRTGTFIKVLMW